MTIRGLANPYLIWCVSFVISMAVTLSGHVNIEPYLVYMAAGQRWLAHAPLYETQTIDGFQYLPQAAILFAPFAKMGAPTADILWRALGWGVYALGVSRLARLLMPSRARDLFLIATCFTIAPAHGSLAIGQANLAMAALALNAVADLIEQRWWRAAALLTLGLALKPLMAVLILLVWALYRPMTWRLPLTLALLFAAPFLLREPAYVVAQYRDCFIKLRMCDRPDRYFEDLRGLFSTLGWSIPHTTFLVLRMLAALATLAICLRVRRRILEPHASLLIAGFAGIYLMLFNPRTQSNSYVMTAPIATLLGAAGFLDGRRRTAIALFAVALGWSANSTRLHFTEYWLKPLTGVVFCALLVREVSVRVHEWYSASRI